MNVKEQAERGIELHKAAIEKTMHFARADFLKHAENTYRPLAEAYLALRQQYEHLPALVEFVTEHAAECPKKLIVTRAIYAVHNADNCDWCMARSAAIRHFQQQEGEVKKLGFPNRKRNRERDLERLSQFVPPAASEPQE